MLGFFSPVLRTRRESAGYTSPARPIKTDEKGKKGKSCSA